MEAAEAKFKQAFERVKRCAIEVPQLQLLGEVFNGVLEHVIQLGVQLGYSWAFPAKHAEEARQQILEHRRRCKAGQQDILPLRP